MSSTMARNTTATWCASSPEASTNSTILIEERLRSTAEALGFELSGYTLTAYGRPSTDKATQEGRQQSQ